MRARTSLLWHLSAGVITVVIVVVGLQAAHAYLSQRRALIESMQRSTALSIASLRKNIAPFIDAYAVNEYENLIATEIGLRQHLAIVVNDLRMGAILGQGTYVTGKLRDSQGTIVDFDPKRPAHQERIAGAFYKVSEPILSATGEPIGNVTVYTSDEAMKHRLAEVLYNDLIAIAAMALLLIGLLALSLHRLLVRPLSRIALAISQRDADGLPLAPAPDFGYREIAVLTDTMNGMVEVIRRARDALQVEHTRLQNVIDGTGAGTWEWNVQTGETIFNERWAEIIGCSLAELGPLSIDTWLRYAHPDDLARSNANLQRHFAGETPYYECEARVRHKDGHWVWVLDRGRVLSWTEDGKPLWMFGTHIDISPLKEHERQLEHLAQHDALTGLPNRALLADRLALAMPQARRRQTMLALVYLDLDGLGGQRQPRP